MKCDYCGGNLTLEDAFCSHCGMPNTHAEQHIQNMKHFKGEFENTKKRVYKTTRSFTEITVRIAMIAVLLILIVIVIGLGSSSYRITSYLERSRAERNFRTYSQTLDEYLEEENYQQFVAFIQRNNISTFDSSYEQYAAVSRAGREYVNLYEYIMRIVAPPTYQTDSSGWVERVAVQLDYFYDTLDMENYIYYEGADAELYVTAMEHMESTVQRLLVTYLKISPEEAAQLKEMTSAKRAYLLEESVNNG